MHVLAHARVNVWWRVVLACDAVDVGLFVNMHESVHKGTVANLRMKVRGEQSKNNPNEKEKEKKNDKEKKKTRKKGEKQVQAERERASTFLCSHARLV